MAKYSGTERCVACGQLAPTDDVGVCAECWEAEVQALEAMLAEGRDVFEDGTAYSLPNL